MFSSPANQRDNFSALPGHAPPVDDLRLMTQDPNDAPLRLPELSLPAGVSPERLLRRREMQNLVNSQRKSLESHPVARGLNDSISRDHWPRSDTVLAAEGGMPRGHVYGTSDKQRAYPAKDLVPLGDLSATMFELLGIPAETEMRGSHNRPFPVADGRPIAKLIA